MHKLRTKQVNMNPLNKSAKKGDLRFKLLILWPNVQSSSTDAEWDVEKQSGEQIS